MFAIKELVESEDWQTEADFSARSHLRNPALRL
jgi:hypothetical protein